MNIITIINKKLELLTKATWNTKDIMEWYQVKQTKALEIKNKVLGQSPKIKVNDNRRERVVNSDEVLKFDGSSRKKELEIINEIRNHSFN